jgi:hypothetical protein
MTIRRSPPPFSMVISSFRRGFVYVDLMEHMPLQKPDLTSSLGTDIRSADLVGIEGCDDVVLVARLPGALAFR